MLKLTFHRDYRSIPANLPELVLPSFTALTGVNGSGKTHLLRGVAEQQIRARLDEADLSSTDIAYFDWNRLRVPASEHDGTSPSYLEDQAARDVQLLLELTRNLSRLRELHEDSTALTYATDVIASSHDSSTLRALSRSESDELGHITMQLHEQSKLFEVVEWIESESGHSLLTMDEAAVLYWLPIQREKNDPFGPMLQALFTAYHRKHVDNKYNRFLQSEGEVVPCLSDDAFAHRWEPPPWDVVNRLFDSARLPIRVNRPKGSAKTPFHLKFHHIDCDRDVESASLSTGEQIVASLSLSILGSEATSARGLHPRLLLFDEIDAPLHPSMCKLVLDTIRKGIVEDLGVSVILATHKPSTVALLDDAQIYAIRKQGECGPRIQSVTRDRSLASLTVGVPTLSVTYENRRQVFVESPNDAQIYDIVFQRLRQFTEIPEISLHFIACGDRDDQGQGCGEVNSLVNRLVKHGNRTVRGLIDWDGKHDGSGSIRVLGDRRRYSIENYLLDPFLLGIYLIHQQLENGDALGLPAGVGYSRLAAMEAIELQPLAQCIVDKAVERVASDTKPNSDGQATTVCTYVNGMSVNVPTWYLEMRGHELEAAILTTFPNVRQDRTAAAFDLMRDVCEKNVQDKADFLSVDFLDTFAALQQSV